MWAERGEVDVAGRGSDAGMAGVVAPQVRPAVESLPFTVRIVHTEVELQSAVAIRHAAYARHIPEFAARLTEPEPGDFDAGSIVLLAESKLDQEPIGTMRIQSNEFGPLALERSVTLPEHLHGKRLAEATRLGITLGRTGRLVKAVLFKALYLHCLEAGIDWMIITARSPLDRGYEALYFEDVFPGRGFLPMRHIGDIPHRVLALDIRGAESRWTNSGHPQLDFFVNTQHPDIRLQPRTPAPQEGPSAPAYAGTRDFMRNMAISGMHAFATAGV